MIRLFVGLGNPGPEYEDTRHNAGFWFIDELARRLGVHLQPDRAYHGLVARANMPQGPVWLLQPMTYMNLSGKSVAPLARFFKIAPEEVLVVHDELDLLPGQVKLKKGGGHGGHNGLRDIHAQLGTPEYWRLRLGIGHPGVKHEVANYVLRKPPQAEREVIFKCVALGLDATDAMLAGDMTKAVTLVHAQPPRPKPPRKEPGKADSADTGGKADAEAPSATEPDPHIKPTTNQD
jgi:PTH1 family peptidyl-tRNA hydrolase